MHNKLEEIILKRNNDEEQKLNFTKIYDLSKIDMLKDLTPDKKYSLLITIKKILLCTNKYVDICNTNEIYKYCLMSFGIFLLYIFFLSPSIKIYLLTEEQSISLQEYSLILKFWYYFITQIIEIIFRIIFNYYRKLKISKIFLYYAYNEINKIKNDFNIEINDTTYDLSINIVNNNNSYKKRNINFLNKKNDEEDFYQYVICYPNVRYYNWDYKLLNEKEKNICNLVKNNIQVIEDNYLLKFSFIALIILILYNIAFYFLTLAKATLFFVFMIILFLFTKIISITLSNELKKGLIANEETMSKFYIKQGYLISFSTCVIQIFKLNNSYKNTEKDINDIYKLLYKRINDIVKNNRIF